MSVDNGSLYKKDAHALLNNIIKRRGRTDPWVHRTVRMSSANASAEARGSSEPYMARPTMT